MDNKDAEHAIELYKAIRQIDGRLEHLEGSHNFIVKVDVWATVSTGNYPIEIEIQDRSPFAPMVRAAIEGQLLREREIRADGLKRIGFDVPPGRPADTEAAGQS